MPARKRNHPEDDLQRAVARFLDVVLPDDAVWFHVPNGGGRSKVEASILKGLGVKAGVPDIVILRAGRGYAIELKPPRPHKSSVSDEQKKFHGRLRAASIPVTVAYSVDDVIAFLNENAIPIVKVRAA